MILSALVGLASAHAKGENHVRLEPQLADSETYGESFTAVADFKDGTYALVQLFVSNAGLGDQKAACRIMVLRPQGKPFNRGERVTKNEWAYEETSNTLRVKDCSLTTNSQKTIFQAVIRDASVTLDIDAPAKRVVPPGHTIRTEDGQYRISMLMPWAKVRARIQMPGFTNRRMDGFVYLDHARSTLLLPDVADSWYRFRGFYGPTPTLVEVRYGPKGESPKGWYWASPDTHPRPVSGQILRNIDADKIGLKVPTDKGHMIITTERSLYVYRPTRQYGLMGKLVKPWVGDPKVTSFRAKMTLPNGSVIRGVLEQTVVSD